MFSEIEEDFAEFATEGNVKEIGGEEKRAVERNAKHQEDRVDKVCPL